jgi:hypothetical protein
VDECKPLFHGPAGVISRSVIASVAAAAGQPLDDGAERLWAKQQWVDMMVGGT